MLQLVSSRFYNNVDWPRVRGLYADYKGMPSAAFVIKNVKQIHVHLKLIFIYIDIVRENRLRKSIEMVALEDLIFVNNHLVAMSPGSRSHSIK